MKLILMSDLVKMTGEVTTVDSVIPSVGEAVVCKSLLLLPAAHAWCTTKEQETCVCVDKFFYTKETCAVIADIILGQQFTSFLCGYRWPSHTVNGPVFFFFYILIFFKAALINWQNQFRLCIYPDTLPQNQYIYWLRNIYISILTLKLTQAELSHSRVMQCR